MRVAIIDGYVDEPSCLGVPPFVSPYPRYLAGAVLAAGHDFSYATIDEARKGAKPGGDLLVVIGGAVVPGRYLRGMPASFSEVRALAAGFEGTTVLGGPMARFGLLGESEEFDLVAGKDVDAFVFDLLAGGEPKNRNRTLKEWNAWALAGARIAADHPDFPQPLVAELDVSRGCARYSTGGCSFCIEPLYGKPSYREPGDIAAEVSALSALGVTNFRLGGQSCTFSYKALDLGTENPRPNVAEVERLLRGVREAAPGLRVLHTDNADPAMVADNPVESRKIIELLVEHCTGGNVLAFGMESADPEVISENNLNCKPEQVFEAIRLVNEGGGASGENGMPMLLPGLNFLGGLPGESKRTYELNYEFLKRVLDAGLMVRRINIRQVNPVRLKQANTKHYREFRKFKERVRREIDEEMLKRVVPAGTVLRDVFLEMREGKTTFGRQVGTYPLLVGLPYAAGLDRFVDVWVTSHGQRSVTGFEFPMDVNSAGLDALASLPDVGERRAARIIKARPFVSPEEFAACLDDEVLAERLLKLIKL